MIDTVIVEDDENASASLEMMLEDMNTEFRILGKAFTFSSAIELIDKMKPSLVFLDIELPDGLGYDLPKKTTHKGYKIIFTTTHSEFAIKAFELAALHYLLKPFNSENLQEAIERYSKTVESDMLDIKLSVFKESMIEKPQKIILPSSGGSVLYNINDIVSCNSSDNYCYVNFNNGQQELVTKTLASLERTLVDSGFIRVHNQHLINMRYIKKYQTGNSPRVFMNSGTEHPISETYRKNFSDKLKQFAKKP